MFILYDRNGEKADFTIGNYPDGTLNLRIPDKNDIFGVDWYYENDSELFTLICIAKSIPNSLDLFLPYIPHARMDRVKNSEDVFTLKYFCEIINSLNFNKVFVVDPHSNISTALLNNISVININGYIKNMINYLIEVYDIEPNDLICFYPDEGAMKRYSEEIKQPYAFGIKKRNWSDGKILGLDIVNKELVKDKVVLIIDDICSRGGTFYHSAKALQEAGAKAINLYITHAENTMFEGEMYNEDLMDNIFTLGYITDYSKDVKNKIRRFEDLYDRN